jgi:putative ABC transport system permease protein
MDGIERLFDLLLRALPEQARKRYGREIADVALSRIREAGRAGGSFSAARAVARECAGIVAAGVVGRSQARRLARPARLQTRDARRGPKTMSMTIALRHLRIAARGLWKQPAFTLVAAGALALGIGASIAIFTVFHAVVLRPLPFRDPDRLVSIWEKNPERGWVRAQVAAANYLDWRAQARGFVDMAAHDDWLDESVLVANGEPSVVYANRVTGNFFDVLGVPPRAGRGFSDEDTWARNEPSVVLSYAFWRRQFGASEEAIGRSVEIDGIARRIVGVMPEGFNYPFPGTDLWVPTAWEARRRDQVSFRRAHGMRVLGRLSPGVAPGEAETELVAIARRLEAEYPETNRKMGTGLTPLREWIVGDASRPLRILMAATGLLLLIACANVANMLLARGAARQNELGIKKALGGGRRALLLEGLLESLLLAGVGGAIGLALGLAAVRPLLALGPESLPRTSEVGVDPVVVLFALGVSAASGILFGIVPAWRGASVESGMVLSARARGASGRVSRATRLLVAAEVALTLPLVVGAGLLVRTLSHLSSVDPGFSREGVLVARLSLPSTRYEEDERIGALYRDLIRSIASIPGVEGAAMSSRLPFGNQRWSSDFTVDGWPPDRFGIDVRHDEVTPGWIRTMKVPLLRGRDFDFGDREGAAPVVLVNEALAKKYFPSEDPIGKRVTFDRVPDESSTWRTIVGVVGNVRREALSLEEQPSFYAPVLQDTNRVMHLLVRAERDPAALTSLLREKLRALDPSVPLFDVTTLDAVVASSVGRERFLLSLLALAAGIALALASVGIFGVVFYSTTRRAKEIGIRVALGARSASVVALVVRSAMRPVLLGLGLGVLGAAFSARALSGFLFEVDPFDPLTFVVVVLVMLATALLACAVPARWATRVEAASALRAE